MGSDPARQAHLAHFQVPMRGDPGEITVFFKDFADAQVGKHLLQVVVTGDGQPGHKHICDPREEKVTKVNSGALPFFQAGFRIDGDEASVLPAPEVSELLSSHRIKRDSLSLDFKKKKFFF